MSEYKAYISRTCDSAVSVRKTWTSGSFSLQVKVPVSCNCLRSVESQTLRLRIALVVSPLVLHLNLLVLRPKSVSHEPVRKEEHM